VLKLKQEELAERLGLKRSATISDWERGLHTAPLERVEQIAALAGIHIRELTGEPDDTPTRYAKPLSLTIDDISTLCRALEKDADAADKRAAAVVHREENERAEIELARLRAAVIERLSRRLVGEDESDGENEPERRLTAVNHQGS
jgi:transcriptional regulator with XRE-family HTH domain